MSGEWRELLERAGYPRRGCGCDDKMRGRGVDPLPQVVDASVGAGCTQNIVACGSNVLDALEKTLENEAEIAPAALE